MNEYKLIKDESILPVINIIRLLSFLLCDRCSIDPSAGIKPTGARLFVMNECRRSGLGSGRRFR